MTMLWNNKNCVQVQSAKSGITRIASKFRVQSPECNKNCAQVRNNKNRVYSQESVITRADCRVQNNMCVESGKTGTEAEPGTTDQKEKTRVWGTECRVQNKKDGVHAYSHLDNICFTLIFFWKNWIIFFSPIFELCFLRWAPNFAVFCKTNLLIDFQFLDFRLQYCNRWHQDTIFGFISFALKTIKLLLFKVRCMCQKVSVTAAQDERASRQEGRQAGRTAFEAHFFLCVGCGDCPSPIHGVHQSSTSLLALVMELRISGFFTNCADICRWILWIYVVVISR